MGGKVRDPCASAFWNQKTLLSQRLIEYDKMVRRWYLPKLHYWRPSLWKTQSRRKWGDDYRRTCLCCRDWRPTQDGGAGWVSSKCQRLSLVSETSIALESNEQAYRVLPVCQRRRATISATHSSIDLFVTSTAAHRSRRRSNSAQSRFHCTCCLLAWLRDMVPPMRLARALCSNTSRRDPIVRAITLERSTRPRAGGGSMSAMIVTLVTR
jgi:hypothetical protein